MVGYWKQQATLLSTTTIGQSMTGQLNSLMYLNKYPRYEGLRRGSAIETWEVSSLHQFLQEAFNLPRRTTIDELRGVMPEHLHEAYWQIGDLISDLAYDCFDGDVRRGMAGVYTSDHEHNVSSRHAVIKAISLIGFILNEMKDMWEYDNDSVAFKRFATEFDTTTNRTRQEALLAFQKANMEMWRDCKVPLTFGYINDNEWNIANYVR